MVVVHQHKGRVHNDVLNRRKMRSEMFLHEGVLRREMTQIVVHRLEEIIHGVGQPFEEVHGGRQAEKRVRDIRRRCRVAHLEIPKLSTSKAKHSRTARHTMKLAQ